MPDVPQRYSSLRTVGQIVRIVGMVAAILGVVLILFAFGEMREYQGNPLAFFLGGGFALMLGLITTALGEIAVCFVGIEHNTRRTAVATERKGQPASNASPSAEAPAGETTPPGETTSGGDGQEAGQVPPDHWRCECGANVLDTKDRCPYCGRRANKIDQAIRRHRQS